MSLDTDKNGLRRLLEEWATVVINRRHLHHLDAVGILVIGLIVSTVSVSAQVQMGIPGSMPTSIGNSVINNPLTTRAGSLVRVMVLDENKKPLKSSALVRLTSRSTGRVYFLTTRASQANFDNIPSSKYLIEVGAFGYLGAHAEVEIHDTDHDLSETVTLVHDPVAVDLKLDDSEHLSSGSRKEAQKGLEALELSNLPEARKHLEAANRKSPSSYSINFLLAYVALRENDPDRELLYLDNSIKLNPHNLQAQNLLGQLYYQRGDYAHAAEAEAVVVSASAESLPARKILANSYLKLKEYEKARDQSQWLVDHGGIEGSAARLVLGQALAALRQDQPAIQNLTTYLDQNPSSSVAPQIRQLISQLQKQQLADGPAISIADPELAGNSGFSSTGMPADIDEQRPSLVAGVPCPANILEATEQPSKHLVASVAQISAIEHMVHEDLSVQGTPRTHQTRQFNYVASISESGPAGLAVQEYRDQTEMPDNITTTGLAVLAVAFHPVFRNEFEMHCEGLGNWDGQPAWLVHFRQLDDKPTHLRSYVVNKTAYPVHLKGRAWILADNLQVVHLETDLVRPIPEIQLKTEHTFLTYGPVEFKSSGTDLWLPKTAELYVELGKLRFRRSESFDHFMLFATDVQEQRSAPKNDPPPSPAQRSPTD